MNIIWILTDGICTYERPGDSFGITPSYQKLIRENEGFYFSNAKTLFGSTVYSFFSMFTGRFPYYTFPDYYTKVNFPKEFMENNFPKYLKDAQYSVKSVIMWQEGCKIFKDILNPYYEDGI